MLRKINGFFVAIIIILTCIINIPVVSADNHLDQYMTETWPYAYIEGEWEAQSFVPELDTITCVKLYLRREGVPSRSVKVSIRSSLNGNDLTSRTYTMDSIPTEWTWVEFDFPDISITPGQTYYIVAHIGYTSNNDGYSWYQFNGDDFGFYDAYWDGKAYSKNSGSWNEYAQTRDFTFKTYGGTDDDQPSVTITDPSHGDYERGCVVIEVDAIDWGTGIDYIEYYVDNILKHTETQPLYYFYGWDSTSVVDGNHFIEVKAYDFVDNVGSDSITITIDNTLPSVSIITPEDDSLVGGSVHVTVSSSDNYGISYVKFFIDNLHLKTDYNSPYEYNWDATSYEEGSHTIKAQSIDIVGNHDTDIISVTVDNTVPSVSITNPDDSAEVSGDVLITASASDSSGIDCVKFFIDTSHKSTDDNSPYEYLWNSESVNDGTHTIKAKAYDNAGNDNSHTITITVDNENLPPNQPICPSWNFDSGIHGIDYTFSTSTTDLDTDDIQYGWDWNGDGMIDEWSEFISSGSTDLRDHKWSSPGTYCIKVKAKDTAGAESTWSNELCVTLINSDPDEPDDPSPGNNVNNVDINTELSWTCIDPNSDDLVYDLYFGIDPDNLDSITDLNQPEYNPGTLDELRTYHWYVVARDPYDCTSISNPWTFTTRGYNDPELTNAGVDIDKGDPDRPGWGRQKDEFRFYVNYYDADGDEPKEDGKKLIIKYGSDIQEYNDIEGEGSDSIYECILNGRDIGGGSYFYHFEFTDTTGKKVTSDKGTIKVNYAPEASFNGPNNLALFPKKNREGEFYIDLYDEDTEEGDQISFYIDWDDGSNTGWKGPYDSGETFMEPHTFNEAKDYNLDIKVKDSNDDISELSWKVTVKQTNNKLCIKENQEISNFFKILKLLKIKTHIFIFSRLINFFYKLRNPDLNFDFEMGMNEIFVNKIFEKNEFR